MNKVKHTQIQTKQTHNKTQLECKNKCKRHYTNDFFYREIKKNKKINSKSKN